MTSKLLALAIASILLFTNQIYGQNIKEYTPLDPATLNSEEFGQGTAIGFNIFGDGLGFMVRRTLNNEDQIGLNTGIFWNYIFDASTMRPEGINLGFYIRPEFNFYMGNTFKEKHKRSEVKRKYRKHYISLKAIAGISSSSNYGAAITWHRETFLVKNKSHARGLDLGINYLVFPGGSIGFIGERSAFIGLFLRLDWTWFRHMK